MNRGSPVITVAQLQKRLRRATEDVHDGSWVQGEVASLKGAPSGHVYFTLKDEREDAVIDCVMYRSSAFRARRFLSDGARIELRGRPSIYVPRGRLQFIADSARLTGRGALLEALEKLKEKLTLEGLFDPGSKRPLPRNPQVVGVVTSRSGAAFFDIARVALRRANVKLVLAPALVQGEEAPQSLIRAINLIERYPGLDVLIVGRGGGSAEDLMAFNDERVVRRLFALDVPVVSAVGHEVDFSLCDLVADVRAATPSEAAELVVAERALFQKRLMGARRQLGRSMLGRLYRAKSEVAVFRAGLSDPRFVLAQRQQRLDELHLRLERAQKKGLVRQRALRQGLAQRLSSRHPRVVLAEARARLAPCDARLGAALRRAIAARRARFSEAASTLEALSPLAVLGRGYAIVRDAEGRVVRSARSVTPGLALRIRVHEGIVLASVTGVHEPEDETRG